jgi:hypothetical protein
MHLNKGYLGKNHHFITKVNHRNLHLPNFEKNKLCSSYFYLLGFSFSTYTIMAPLVPPSNFKWKINFGSSAPSHVVNLITILQLQILLNPCLYLPLHMNLPNKKNLQRKRIIKLIGPSKTFRLQGSPR